MDFLRPSQAVSTTETALPPTTMQDYDEEDHVMWQSSQSVALKQLLHTPDEGVRTTRGWQRESSFDQIPGFSRLSTSDASTSSSSSSTRPAPSRSRRPQSPAISAIPLKSESSFTADPTQLLHLMKDVSARLDQNVPVRPRSCLGPERTKTDRKTRSGATPFASSRPPAKRSRIEALRNNREEDAGLDATDKGKARAHSFGDLDIESSSPSQGFTPSQIQMPPPPGPSSKRHIAPPNPIPLVSPSVVPTKHQQQPLQPKQPCLPPEKSAPSVLTTKSHPPRVQVPASKPAPVDRAPEFPPDRRQSNVSAAAPASTQGISSQPPPTSQSGTRPPSLGMRRTHTFPLSTSLQKNNALPTRQKGFKPPLISGSQPQMSQQQKVTTPITPRAPACNGGSFRSPSESPSISSSFSSNASMSTSASISTSATSVSSSSSRSRRSSASPAPVEYGARKAAFSKSVSASTVTFTSHSASSVKVAPDNKPPDDASMDSLPEPQDTDPDSSFGDMSFDIDADALEAAMRMYD